MRETKIQWATHTFNPWRGCTKVSAGCANCYAERQSKRNLKVLGQWGPEGTRVVASEAQWREPLKWDRAAAKAGVRRRVFCASLADVFEDWQNVMNHSNGEVFFKSPLGSWCTGGEKRLYDEGHVPYTRPPEVTMQDVRNRLFRLIDATPNLDWLLLTKRPENVMRLIPPHSEYLRDDDVRRNLWIGTSVEDHATADERISHLLQVPAALRFLSVEPLLGPVDLDACWPGGMPCPGRGPYATGIDWVIVGGESGPGARPCDVEWIRSIVRQCKAAGVVCFVKQLGSYPIMSSESLDQWVLQGGKLWDSNHNDDLEENWWIRLSDPKGGDPAEWPEDLRVRELPRASDG